MALLSPQERRTTSITTLQTYNTEKCVPPRMWNPLNDDGDALRLAVKCSLDIRFESHENGVSVEACGMWDDAPCGKFETFEKEGFEATRRSIVRAAAEIGRSMQ